MSEEEQKLFLTETKYCDFNNPTIAKLANDFEKKYGEDRRGLVRALFYFVRDHTEYEVGNWTQKASDTLRKGRGTCTNNTNLLVALFRSAGIPAGYGILDVKGKEYFGPIVPEKLSRNISKKSKHIYCYVYFEGTWLRCDPSDDEPLSLATQHINPQSTLVEWDGFTDALLHLSKKHIINDTGPHPNIDHIIRKKMRFSLKLPVYIANLYIKFLRQNAHTIKTSAELEIEFELWLKKNYYISYILYRWFFWWQHLDIFFKYR
jgi:hypothetical protein